MVTSINEHLKPIATFLNVKLVRPKDIPGNGVISTIFEFIEASKSSLGPLDNTEKAELYQWIEYGLLYVSKIKSSPSLNPILSDLNRFLSTRTYFVAQRFTIADVFLFYKLHKFMDSLTILEKEKYLNLSRWFDNLQNDDTLRQNRKLIDFSTNYLAAVAPARH